MKGSKKVTNRRRVDVKKVLNGTKCFEKDFFKKLLEMGQKLYEIFLGDFEVYQIYCTPL